MAFSEELLAKRERPVDSVPNILHPLLTDIADVQSAVVKIWNSLKFDGSQRQSAIKAIGWVETCRILVSTCYLVKPKEIDWRRVSQFGQSGQKPAPHLEKEPIDDQEYLFGEIAYSDYVELQVGFAWAKSAGSCFVSRLDACFDHPQIQMWLLRYGGWAICLWIFWLLLPIEVLSSVTLSSQKPALSCVQLFGQAKKQNLRVVEFFCKIWEIAVISSPEKLNPGSRRCFEDTKQICMVLLVKLLLNQQPKIRCCCSRRSSLAMTSYP